MAIIIRLSGNNVIVATAAADQITAGSGNDTINAGAGSNTIDAGEGNNCLTAGNGDDDIISGAGNDGINAGAGHNRIRAGAGNNVITSGAGNDNITSGSGNDTINAGDGLNTIDAGGGVNVITSGSGNDDITSGAGNDVINAGAGNNTVNAGDGLNVITSGSGNDAITTGSGNDVINAGDGNNTIGAGAGNNVIITGSGSDSIASGAGNDVINAGNGNNTVTSGAGNDVVVTGSGADLIDAGGNNDVVNSGIGNDVIVHRIAENAGSLDQYDGSLGQDALRLDLSAAEWARADVQADVAAFLARANPSAFFRFSSTNLTVVNIERLEVFVEGVQLANPANEAVSAVADSINATEDTPTASANLLLNDSVPDRAASVTLIGSSTLGTVSLASSLGGAVQTATLSFVPNASLQSLPPGETRSETLQYRVQDVNGDFSIASVTITVTGVNDAPTLQTVAGISYTDTADDDGFSATGGTLVGQDIDSGTTLSYGIDGGTAGSYTVGADNFDVARTGSYGTLYVNASTGAYRFVPDDSAIEALKTTTTETFQLTVSDGIAAPTQQALVVTLNGANDTPEYELSGPIALATNEDTGVTSPLTVIDRDTGETITYSVIGAASNGVATANADGSFNYQPNANFFGADSFTLKATDASGAADTVVVNVKVASVNDPASISGNASGVVSEDGITLASGLLSVSDADTGENQLQPVAAGTLGANGYGSFEVKANGEWTYTLDNSSAKVQGLKATATVEDTLIVQSKDGSASQTLTVSIAGKNDSPVAKDTSFTVSEDGAVVTGSLSATDPDANTTLSFSLNAGVPPGLTLNTDGSYSFDPSDPYYQSLQGNGNSILFTLPFTVKDEQNATSSAIWTITVNGVNDDASIAGNAKGAVSEDGTLQASGLLRVSDVDTAENQLQPVPVGTPGDSGYGTFQVKANGIWTYTLNNSSTQVQGLKATDTVEDTFTVKSRDGTASQTLTVSIVGKDDSAPVIDLSTLSAVQGFIIQGDASDDQAGYSVSSAGDVNGDGFDDLIVGAPAGDDGGDLSGEAYVIFGSSDEFGTADSTGRRVIDLGTLSAAQGFSIRGDKRGDQAGRSVSSIGDINGDGIDDLVVGAPYAEGGAAPYDWGGEAYVVFGQKGPAGGKAGDGGWHIDLSTLGVADGFLVKGHLVGDLAGWSVSAAGDVNGDGFDDVIVGVLGGDDGGTDSGEAYVVLGAGGIFGHADANGRQVVDLNGFGAAEGIVIQGDENGDQAGFSISWAGDVNGDGVDDLIIGAVNGDDGGNESGEAYVVFGAVGGFGGLDGSGRRVLDLSTLSAAQGFIIKGDAEGDQAGYGVSSAGDVNGDGFDDIIVGATGGDDGGGLAGEAYVVFGRSGGFGAADGTGRQVIDLSTLSAAQGFIVQGDADVDLAGSGVSSAGDVNGDGFDDLIVGAPGGDDGGTNAGEAYVIFGGPGDFGSLDATGRQSIDLSSLGEADGFIIQGDESNDLAGKSVSRAGDVNHDGFADLIVGAYGGDDGEVNAGEAYVVFGGPFGASATPVLTTGSAAAEILIGGRGNDQLSGGGGADVLRAGAGNDTLSVPDTAAQRIDGGLGQDTLAFTGAGLSIGLIAGTTGLLGARISGIEALDITGSGNNALSLDAAYVLNAQSSGNTAFNNSPSRNTLVVLGNAGDTLVLQNSGAVGGAEWDKAQDIYSLSGDGGVFNFYELIAGTSVIALVGVSVDVMVDVVDVI